MILWTQRAEAQKENTKTNSFSKCMHKYPVESRVKFCFSFVYLQADWLPINSTRSNPKSSRGQQTQSLYWGLYKNSLCVVKVSQELSKLVAEIIYAAKPTVHLCFLEKVLVHDSWKYLWQQQQPAETILNTWKFWEKNIRGINLSPGW